MDKRLFNIFSSKKGDVVSFVLTPTFRTLLALGIVLLYLLWFVNGISAQTGFERQYYSRDMALLLDTILSLPGNFEGIYLPIEPELKGNFTFMINEEEVKVKDKGENSYPYSLRKDLTFKPVQINPSKEGTQIKIIKTNDELIIKEPSEKKSFSEKLKCYAPKKSFSSIIIDASHLNNPNSEHHDLGNINENINEADLTLKLGKAIKNSAQINVEETKFLERASEGKQANTDAPIGILERVEKILNSEAELLMGLQFGSEEDFYVKAYVHPKNYEQNYITACHVVNKISEELFKEGKQIKGTAIMPLNPNHTNDKSDDILSSKDGFILEVGSVKNAPTENEMITIANAINEALK